MQLVYKWNRIKTLEIIIKRPKKSSWCFFFKWGVQTSERWSEHGLRSTLCTKLLVEHKVWPGVHQGTSWAWSLSSSHHRYIDSRQGRTAVDHLNNINAHNECSVGFWDVDVTQEEAVNEQIDMISSQYGGHWYSIILRLSGVTVCQLTLDHIISNWRKIFDVNTHGSFLVARAVARFGLPRPILYLALKQIKINNPRD